MSRILFLAGPTASGKSDRALELARLAGAEIVNADVFQMYRGLDIGTSKPSSEARRSVTHHLLDILDPEETFSAGEFVRRARAVLDEIAGRGRPAVVVGGSGFYLRALRDGLHQLPRVPSGIRDALVRRLEQEGLERLRERLLEVDPRSAERIHPQDRQRTVRALELFEATGKTWSEWLLDAEAERLGPLRRSCRGVRLTYPRSVLYDRIAVRLDRMIASGWIGEVRELLAGGVRPDAPAFRAIGYRAWVAYLQGHVSLEAARDEALRATVQYAKRQDTWFRSEPWWEIREGASAAGEVPEWARWLEAGAGGGENE